MIDKVIFEITKRTVSAKELECCVEHDRVVRRPLDADRSTSPSITDDEIKADRQAGPAGREALRASAGCRVGGHRSATTVAASCICCRADAETVWSNKPRQVSHGVHTGVEGVVEQPAEAGTSQALATASNRRVNRRVEPSNQLGEPHEQGSREHGTFRQPVFHHHAARCRGLGRPVPLPPAVQQGRASQYDDSMFWFRDAIHCRR